MAFPHPFNSISDHPFYLFPSHDLAAPLQNYKKKNSILSCCNRKKNPVFNQTIWLKYVCLIHFFYSMIKINNQAKWNRPRDLHNVWRGRRSVSAAKQRHPSAETTQHRCSVWTAQRPLHADSFPPSVFSCERLLRPRSLIYCCDLNHPLTREWRHSGLSAPPGCAAGQKGSLCVQDNYWNSAERAGTELKRCGSEVNQTKRTRYELGKTK